MNWRTFGLSVCFAANDFVVHIYICNFHSVSVFGFPAFLCYTVTWIDQKGDQQYFLDIWTVSWLKELHTLLRFLPSHKIAVHSSTFYHSETFSYTRTAPDNKMFSHNHVPLPKWYVWSAFFEFGHQFANFSFFFLLITFLPYLFHHITLLASIFRTVIFLRDYKARFFPYFVLFTPFLAVKHQPKSSFLFLLPLSNPFIFFSFHLSISVPLSGLDGFLLTWQYTITQYVCVCVCVCSFICPHIWRTVSCSPLFVYLILFAFVFMHRFCSAWQTIVFFSESCPLLLLTSALFQLF